MYHLLLWHDKINNNYFIIILINEDIAIINLLNGKLYWKFKNYTGDFDFNLNANKTDHAYIYKKDNNYYLVDLNYDTVTIWDLYKKCRFTEFDINIRINKGKLNKDDEDDDNIYKLKRLVKWNNNML